MTREELKELRKENCKKKSRELLVANATAATVLLARIQHRYISVYEPVEEEEVVTTGRIIYG